MIQFCSIGMKRLLFPSDCRTAFLFAPDLTHNLEKPFETIQSGAEYNILWQKMKNYNPYFLFNKLNYWDATVRGNRNEKKMEKCIYNEMKMIEKGEIV